MKIINQTYFLNIKSYAKNNVLYLLIITFFWLTLFWTGYPKPHGDDLFFIGAAMNLVKKGKLYNPYISDWNAVFDSGNFFLQPPFHSYILAGWLYMMGISTRSFLLFQCICYLLFSLSFLAFTRVFKLPKFLLFIVLVLFAIWHTNTGLRQDALGVAILFTGIAILSINKYISFILGVFLLCCAIFISPITIAYSFPVGCMIFINNYNKKSNQSKTRVITKYILSLALSLASVITVFLICINFKVNEFIEEFTRHASMRRTPTRQAFSFFFDQITKYGGLYYQLPKYILFVFLLILLIIKRKEIDNNIYYIVLALSVGLIINIILYTSALGFITFFLWITILIILCEIPVSQKLKRLILIVSTFTFVLSNAFDLVNIFFVDSSFDKVKIGKLYNHKNVVYDIDESAARYIFDYNLPENSQSWNFKIFNPRGFILKKQYKSNDIWIISRANLCKYFPETCNQIYIEKVKILGHKFNSIVRKPNALIVISEKNVIN